MFQSCSKFVTGPVLAIAKISQEGAEPFMCAHDRKEGTSFGDVDKWVLFSVAEGAFQGALHTS